MATAVSAALPALASTSFLPIADTADDPGVLHAEGLAYLSESGFPTNWDRESALDAQANTQANTQDNVMSAPQSPNPVSSGLPHEASILQPGRDSLDDYFDSAPVAGLGEPAPVITLAPLPEKKS
jgi:hypothetical protein